MYKKINSAIPVQKTVLLLLSASLWSCFPERFRHEKYECSGSLFNIKAIVLNKAETGNHAKIISSSGEKEAYITEITAETTKLESANMRIKINRKTGAVTATFGAKYQSTVCKKSVFKM